MTFLQLNYVTEIYNCGSINKAAQNLFVSQSSLSNSIRELEDELGIKIFIRSNRGIILTDDGREFITQVRPIIEQHKKVEKFYRDRDENSCAILKISSQRYPFCADAFVNMLKENVFENFEFTFKETDMDKVIENVSQRKSDIGILFLSDMSEKFMNRILSANDLEYNEIARIRPHVFINKDHVLAGKEHINLSELTDYPYIVFSKKDNTTSNYSEEAVFCGSLDFKKIIYVNDRATVYNIISHTDAFTTGSGILPTGYAPDNITSIPIGDNLDYMRLVWIKLKDLNINPLAEKFINKLEQALKEI